MAKNVNRLTRMQQRTMEDWLIGNRSKIEADGATTIDNLAAAMALDLAFDITRANVDAALKVVGVKVGTPERGSNPTRLRVVEAGVATGVAERERLAARLRDVEVSLQRINDNVVTSWSARLRIMGGEVSKTTRRLEKLEAAMDELDDDRVGVPSNGSTD